MYPANGEIHAGYARLVSLLLEHQVCLIDGYSGVDWDEVTTHIHDQASALGKTVQFASVAEAMLPEKAIWKLVEPFLGGDDPLFGSRTTLQLADFFDTKKLAALQPDPTVDLYLVYGCGAALLHWDAPIAYFDVPKNEIQRRIRAGTHRNLGAMLPTSFKATYKRCYFVDWIVLNKHKQQLLPQLEWIADQQVAGTVTWTSGAILRQTLHRMSTSCFRVRPWFEPGVWGGDWMKNHLGLDQDAPNYAWSFEMIVPENGLLIHDSGNTMEISFDLLMYQESDEVLGKAAKRFGYDFPIRFDFLDTFNGGNLSLQCHPSPEYAKAHFGEHFTQDETYYILDAAPDAQVYLGFQENIDPKVFRQALETSFERHEALDVSKFVQVMPSHKHELFLIPHGTVHCSGINNLVLEISATPYIFTFKMYDWLRVDLDGHPRPLNIDRAFENLNFSRKGNVVQETLVSRPQVVQEGPDWKQFKLPTHPEHFYEIHRYEFDTLVNIDTHAQCHVLMLVEGTTVDVETENGYLATFHFAETFAIPAAAARYRLTNRGPVGAKVVVAFVKEEACHV
ncbi:class I mannose-6-phosphate isomerase [Parapedobacter koreensis]|uniref:class I mannose-6-phosphate isomerase n=1 Tax=Parapedobacter koreensis TaxID=332977 RepID=UPI001FDF6741|nr:class I mannose-6-phosphate isomerase [Parapedobacter koreensis]